LTNLEFNNSSLHFSAKICLATPVAIFTSKAVQTRNVYFVNGRSVESFRLQKSFDSIFTSRDLLCPFASFSLLIDPQRVDVNIHPTKKLVYFLCEDDIIEFIGKQIEKFVNEAQSRQSIQINNLNEELKEDCSKKSNKNNRKRKAENEKEIIFEENEKNLNNLNCSLPSSKSSFLNVSSKIQSNSSKVAPKNKIRVDFLNRSLDEFVLTNEDLNLRPNSSVRLSLLKKVAFEEENNEGGSNINPIEINEIERENEENFGGKTNNKVDCCIPREFSFNSLVDLRKEICQKADNKLVELFKKHLLIGFFDSENALIQSENNVFLINNNEILRQFFYQLIIFSFGNMGAYDLIIQSENSSTKNLSIYQLLLLEEEENEKKVANLCQILVKNREILWDFFSIKIILNSINEDAVLAAIPCLINGYLPEMEGLPLLLYKLANVNYEDEKSCYSEISLALADFHLPSISEEDYENLNEEQQNIFKKQNLRVERTLRSLIFPALRNRFLPSSELEEYIKELTSTAKAFKHFGRC
uniref:DNA mismatch repair protein S5 domain-containing protein n=1 Tax=Meloidogyne floridensis TaxID=298350 RepID=A0A915NNE4_9BILA